MVRSLAEDPLTKPTTQRLSAQDEYLISTGGVGEGCTYGYLKKIDNGGGYTLFCKVVYSKLLIPLTYISNSKLSHLLVVLPHMPSQRRLCI